MREDRPPGLSGGWRSSADAPLPNAHKLSQLTIMQAQVMSIPDLLMRVVECCETENHG